MLVVGIHRGERVESCASRVPVVGTVEAGGAVAAQHLVQQLPQLVPDPPLRRHQRRLQLGVGSGRLPELDRGDVEPARERRPDQVQHPLGVRAVGVEALGQPPHLLHPLAGEVFDRGDHDLRLDREVVLVGAARGAGPFGDAGDRRPVIAVIDQAADRGLHDPPPHLFGPLALGALLPDRRHRRQISKAPAVTC